MKSSTILPNYFMKEALRLFLHVQLANIIKFTADHLIMHNCGI